MEKIKQHIESEKGKDILIVIIVILVGLGSFELGRLSKKNSIPDIKIEYPDQAGNIVSATESMNNLAENFVTINAKNSPEIPNSTNPAGKTFFASSRGSKYYSIGCSAGKSIKQENRVYFSTRDEAERAGYEFSSSCR